MVSPIIRGESYVAEVSKSIALNVRIVCISGGRLLREQWSTPVATAGLGEIGMSSSWNLNSIFPLVLPRCWPPLYCEWMPGNGRFHCRGLRQFAGGRLSFADYFR